MKAPVDCTLQPFFIREVVIKAARQFFDERAFHEVITPSLNKALPLEPNIFAFETNWTSFDNTQPLYLSTSPESGLKKMMGQGIGNCYSLTKCFRQLEGVGSKHNPEFLMLEWYRQDATYLQIMEDVQYLFCFVKTKVDAYLERPSSPLLTFQNLRLDLSYSWPILSLEELLRQYAGIEMSEVIEDAQLQKVATQKGYTTEGATWGQLFDQIFLNEVEPHLPTTPLFLTEFPARLSPLCKVNEQKPYLAERFEIFIAGMELGNGNNENTNVAQLRERSEQERQARLAAGMVAPPVDEAFFEAIEQLTGQSYAGIGLGMDRLAMLMADVPDIAQVEFFALR
jgi:elongation factor P--beta-lysine ligase